MHNNTLWRRIVILALAMVMVLGVAVSTATEVDAAGTNSIGDIGLSWTDASNTSNGSSGLSVSGTTVTFTAKSNRNKASISTTLTITNNKTEPATLSFDYSLKTAGSVSGAISLSSDGSGTYRSEIAAGKSITITLSSKKGSFLGASTTTLTLSNMMLKAAGKQVTTTFKGTTNGTYKVTYGTEEKAVSTSDVALTNDSATMYTLTATPASGYTFLVWKNETTGEFISSNATLTNQYYDETTTISAKFVPSTTALFGVGSVSFDNLTDACTYAKNKGVSQVNLLNSGTLTGSHTIPSGITLLIPFDSANTCYTTEPGNSGGSWLDGKEIRTEPSLYRKLTMAANSSLTVEGAISVSAKHTAGSSLTTGSSHCGAVDGPYGQIDMKDGSSITIKNGGKLYAWGFITGSGSVTAKSGAKVYELMQVAEFRGGTVMSAITGSPDSFGNVFPFTQYYVQNIETLLTLEAGATEYAYTSILVKLGGVQSSSVEFIGANGMFGLNSGYVTKRYDGAADRLILDVYGAVELKSLNIKIYTYSINSDKFVLPITNNITINVHEGSSTSLAQDIALLPGTKVTVDEGASLNIASTSNVFVYDSADWCGKQFVHVSQDLAPVPYAPGKTGNRHSSISSGNYYATADKMGDSTIDVNGTANVDGYIYTTAGNAKITSSKGTGVIKLNSGAGTKTNTYQFKYGIFNEDNKDGEVAINVSPAMLLNGDNSYTATAGAAKGDTFIYTGSGTAGKWVKVVTVTFDANGGSGTMDAQSVGGGVATAIKANAFTAPANYTFAGWNTKADGTGTAYAGGASINVTANTTLYAQWKLKEYTVSFNANGGTGTMAGLTVQHGVAKALTQNAFTKTGHTFAGWATTAGGEVVYADKAQITATANVTLYAVWEAKEYTVTWMVDDQPYTTTTVKYGETVTAPAEVPTKAQSGCTTYTFASWEGLTAGTTQGAENLSFNATFTEGSSHDWTDEVTYMFAEDGSSCYAFRPCSRNEAHVDDATAVINSDVKTPATCSVKGWTTYTATFAVDWAETQTNDVQDIPFADHEWDDAVSYTWEMVDGNWTCTAKRVCTENSEHFEEATAKVTDEVTTTADCKTEEVITYTASFSKTWAGQDAKTVTGEKNPANHVGGTHIKDAFDATVNAPGYTGNTHCTGCGVKIAEGTEIPQLQTKVDATTEFEDEDIPEELSQQYDTVAKIETELKTQIAEQGVAAESTVFYDVILKVSADKGESWEDGSVEHFPEDYKVRVKLPVPEGTTPETHEYFVVHMYSSAAFGKTVGETEMPEVTEVEEDGKYYIEFTVTGLSPIMVGFVEDTHTVTFDGNGATSGEMADQTIGEVTASALTANAFTKTGHTFKGWATTPNGQVAYADKAQVTTADADMTLYAVWETNTYNITWKLNDGAFIFAEEGLALPGSAKYGEEVAISGAFEKIGHSVDTVKDHNGNELAYADNAYSFTMPAEDVTITVAWTVNSYDLTWDIDGDRTTVQVNYGVAILEPVGPTKQGYTFAGWEGTIPATMPAEAITITLKSTWTPAENRYQVETYTMGLDGQYSEPVVETVTEGVKTEDEIVLNPTAAEGFALDTESSVLKAEVAADGSTVLKVYFARNQYKVTWNVDGTLTEKTYYYGADLEVIGDPSKEGHTFDAWLDAEGSEAQFPESMPAADLTYYASWTVNQYTVYFMDADSVIDSKTFDYGADLEVINDPSKVGHTFVKWLDGQGADAEIPEKMPASDLTYYAKWQVNQYDIHWDYDGDGVADETTTAYYGDKLVPADRTKDADKVNTYTFLGWSLQKDGEILEELVVSDETTYYAVFEATPIIYTITFDAQGGADVAAMTGGYEQEISLPEASGKTGYTFIGWAETLDPDAEILEAGSAYTITDDDTLYAVWQINEYTVTWIINGTKMVATYEYGERIKALTPAWEGHTFAGWDKEVPATMPAENLTFTAVWETEKFTIGWDIDADGVADFEDTVNWNEIPVYDAEKHGQITKAPTAEKTYTFAGWTVEPVAAVADAVYTAKFDEATREYTITWIVDGQTTTTSVAYGAVPVWMGDAPTRAEDNYNTYEFACWNTDAQGNGSELTAVTGEAAYYAVFNATAKVYTLTLDLDGGVTDGQNAIVIEGGYGMDVDVPAAPEKTGYTFSGWSEEIPAQLTENKTIKALWTVNQYTISFNTDGGSDVASITKDYGAQIEMPADPTKEGYTFNGWAPAIPATMPAEGMEVTANWLINQYTITFDTVGGTQIAPITQDYNSEVTAPQDPMKEGYTFVMWADENGEEAQVPATVPAGNVKLTAVWSANENTINFYTDENAEEAYHTITANTDAEITEEMKPADPTKSGYHFGGWFDAEGNAVVIGQTMPAKSMDLYAKWNVKQYTIILDLDGGKIGEQSVVTIAQNYGTDVEAPETPVKEGYKFLYWADENGDETELPEKMPAQNMNLKAVWQIQEYTITFQDENGNTLDSITAEYGTVIAVPAVTKEGHTFVKWNSGIPATMPAKDMVITSTWRVNQYLISFNTNGGTIIDTIVADYGAAVTKPADPTKPGYTFDGWDVEFPETMPAGGLTLTAQWVINQYTVQWMNWDGAALGTTTVEHGQKPVFTGTPVKEATDMYSYEFIGWNTAADGSGTGIVDATGAAAYYAQYKQVAKEYTITFNTNGGTAIEAITLGYGSAVQAPADPEKEGYVFAGWDQEIPATMPAQNMTINANWEKVKYTVTFDTDGAGQIPAIEAAWGEAITAPAAPEKEGHTFIGWTDSEGQEAEIPETMPVGGLELKAQWKVNEYTITWNIDGETTVETYEYGAEIVEPADVSKDGYTFIGWDQDVPATMPAEDLELVAQWKYTHTGWKTEDAGITYVIDGEKEYFDTWAKIDGKLYYFNNLSYVLTDICHVISRNGTYEGLFVFDKETGAFASDMTGIYTSNSGDIYYIVKGEAVQDVGLVRTVNDEGVVEYYYFCDGSACNMNGCTHGYTAVKNGVHWVENTNDYLPKNDYTFDENGVIKHHADTSRNGIFEDEDGIKCYYIDGVKAYMGLVEVDGDLYYVRSNGQLVVGRTYWVSKTNGLVEKEGNYKFDEDGKMVVETPDLKNGLYDEDGKLFYYVDGVKTYAGLIKIGEDYYYVKSNCEAVRDGIFWITKTNGLMKQGNYEFDENGKMVAQPVQDVKDGIYQENGGLYYYKDGKLFYAGLIKIDNDYYYVNSSCQVITNQKYWISKTNGLMPERSYTFDAQGRMVNAPVAVEPDTDGVAKNGIVEEQGTLYYYEKGVLTYAGLIEIDGHYYYVKSDCTAVKNGTFWITKTNGIVKQGNYTFDEEGRMITK